jgi:hypothetical protein
MADVHEAARLNHAAGTELERVLRERGLERLPEYARLAHAISNFALVNMRLNQLYIDRIKELEKQQGIV